MLCIQGNRLQAIKWRQWKAHLFQQDGFMSTWSPLNMPRLYNLEWDPREEHEVDFPHGWDSPPDGCRGRCVPLDARQGTARSSREPPTRTSRRSQATCGPRSTSSSASSRSS